MPRSDLGQPEIEHLRLPRAHKKNVCRLDVAVDDPFRMSRVECAANLNADVEQFIERDGIGSDLLLQ
jgi:hypothetical protein